MKKRNDYIFIRHAEAQSNVAGIYYSENYKENVLTEKGVMQAEVLAKLIKEEKPTVIFSSPFVRTMMTAEAISKETGIKIIEDELLKEIQVPSFNKKPSREFDEHIKNSNAIKNCFIKTCEGGESHHDVYLRVLKFLEKVDKQYENKKILVVTHNSLVKMARIISPTNNEFQKKYIEIMSSGLVENASFFNIDYKYEKRTPEGEVENNRKHIK